MITSTSGSCRLVGERARGRYLAPARAGRGARAPHHLGSPACSRLEPQHRRGRGKPELGVRRNGSSAAAYAAFQDIRWHAEAPPSRARRCAACHQLGGQDGHGAGRVRAVRSDATRAPARHDDRLASTLRCHGRHGGAATAWRAFFPSPGRARPRRGRWGSPGVRAECSCHVGRRDRHRHAGALGLVELGRRASVPRPTTFSRSAASAAESGRSGPRFARRANALRSMLSARARPPLGRRPGSRRGRCSRRPPTTGWPAPRPQG